MSAEFTRWEKALQNNAWHAVSYHDPLLRRWQAAAIQARANFNLFTGGNLDLAVLTRQVLRRESEQRGATVDVLFPHGDFWPSVQQWEHCGVHIRNTAGQYHLIQADPWQPDFAKGRDPSRAAVAEEQRRHPQPVAADPRFTAFTGHHTYSSPGQQQALRAVWYAPPASTIAAILPTGSGKSAVAQVPALEFAQHGRLSIMIVPTVALALDQEKALHELAARAQVPLPDQLAYHSALSASQRAGLRERIKNGTQGMLITSPESLVGYLSAALFQAAEQGKLALFTLDEAHLAVQWGRDFRPDFQILAGLRRSLLESCPPDHSFTTLLLTATVTAGDLTTLKQLFSEQGHFQLISGVKLRSEPEYWAAPFKTRSEQQAALDDAALHLPRPMIVYTTTVRDAEAHFARLKTLGLRRIALLTGDSKTADRERVVRGWRHGELDLVVGTSAFGVGIDQAHVRSVVHACIPENADRYYQEVGRGGRDGRASLALTLSSPVDWETARSMAIPTLVTVEVGLGRWEQLFHRSLRQVGLNVFDLNLGVHPPHIIYDGATSRDWNQYTLNLMARAGLLRLHHAPMPPLDPTLTEPEVERQLREYEVTRRVEILHAGHLDPAVWNALVEPIRQQEIMASLRSLTSLEQLLNGEREAGDVLIGEYLIDGVDFIQPQHACGGCPVCRAQGHEPNPGLDPAPQVEQWRKCHIAGSSWFNTPCLNIKVVKDDRDLFEAAKRAVMGGARVIVDPAGQLQEQYQRLQEFSADPLLIEHDSDLLFSPPLPRLLITDPHWAAIPSGWLKTHTVLLSHEHQHGFDTGDSLRGHPHVRLLQ